MSLDIDQLKSKILYRSNYRGSKEMCILLNSFVNNIINQLNFEDLNNLLALLNFDDDVLTKFKTGIKTEVEIKDNRITKLFKNYNYNK
tara:strand:+ start:3732 stop:3995 length:264 start_codon:yes stop_codon:yes gene_type:complete